MRVSLRQIYQKLFKAYGPQDWWPAKTRLEMILGAILTQNTTWSNVEKAIRRLKSKRLLSVRALQNTTQDALKRAIRPSGYYNMKAHRIRIFLKNLKMHHKSLDTFLSQDVHTLRQELLSTEGIGPETADSIVLYAARKPVFVVDAYTRRIFKRLGFIGGDEDYETVRTYFESRLPRDTKLCNEYHALIVRHAKEFCRKIPQCDACPLGDICPKLIG